MTALVSQIFNFDLLPMGLCGALGTLSSIACNGIALSFMPEVIRTRDVSAINLPIAMVAAFNAGVWLSYAILKGDPFFTVS